MDRTRAMGTAMGIIRAGVGTALVVAPKWAGRIWVGPGADGPGSAVFARAIGARDVALGATTLATLGSGRGTGEMLRLGFVADLADATATLAAWPHLDGRRRVAMPAIAAAVGAAGLLATRWARDADRGDHTPNVPGEIRATLADRDVDLRAAEQARV